MDLIKPAELQQRQEQLLNQHLKGELIAQDEIRSLVASRGYPYVRGIASSLLKQYECQPPATQEEKTKWDAYCQMKWVVDKLFFTLQQIAARPETPLKTIEPKNDNRSPKFNTKPSSSAKRPTKRSSR